MKVGFVLNNTSSLVNFFGELIFRIREKGVNVELLLPSPPDEKTLSWINEQEITFQLYYLKRASINPFSELRTILSLNKLLRSGNFSSVFLFTIKPVIYGVIASKLSRIKNITVFIAGFGSIFIEDDRQYLQNIFKRVVKKIYFLTLSFCDLIMIVNLDDLEFLNKKLGQNKSKKVCYIESSLGIDTEYYYPVPTVCDPVTFLYIGRLIIHKGIKEFLEAARVLKKIYPSTKFVVVGMFDTNPSKIDPQYFNSFIEEGIIDYLGELEDVRGELSNASVFVSPSYREGKNKAALEAMSMQRPIITTNAPGCRELVDNQKNGLLVPVADVPALVEAMKYFIDNPQIIPQMGAEGRRIILEKYNLDLASKKIIEAMKL